MSGRDIRDAERGIADKIQTFDTRFLVAIHHGDIDIVKLARQELQNRGFDGEGQWVGFKKARELFGE
ncbi:MAG: hypothetical protein WAZ48_01820 [Lysobacteraceae bacterium]